jgi:hypothetical protein
LSPFADFVDVMSVPNTFSIEHFHGRQRGTFGGIEKLCPEEGQLNINEIKNDIMNIGTNPNSMTE